MPKMYVNINFILEFKNLKNTIGLYKLCPSSSIEVESG